jgi:hypothetical protein
MATSYSSGTLFRTSPAPWSTRIRQPLPAEDVGGIGTRIASASPGSWTAFIGSDGGIGGSDVIRVSEGDGEADMYLWLGPDLAPSAVYRFVAEARQDLPAPLAAARQ